MACIYATVDVPALHRHLLFLLLVLSRTLFLIELLISIVLIGKGLI